uniref:Uncharacterized protein n=1 Tax=Anguilla anguilla TaxID=7936 RepID=A0A0E9Q2Z5_ANGAN
MAPNHHQVAVSF